MSKNKPSLIDKIKVSGWSEEKCLQELRRHALGGNTEWVRYLLEKTNYKTYPELLDKKWWTAGIPETQLRKLGKIAPSMVRHLLDHINPKDLPKDIASVIPQTKTAKDLVIVPLSTIGTNFSLMRRKKKP